MRQPVREYGNHDGFAPVGSLNSYRNDARDLSVHGVPALELCLELELAFRERGRGLQGGQFLPRHCLTFL